MENKQKKSQQKAYEIRLKKIKSNNDIMKKIKTSNDAYEYAKSFWSDDIGIYESMFMILMNQAGMTTGWAKISQGGTCQTTFDIKILCKIAIDSLAQQIILVHNHPSEGLKPGEEDKKITENAKNALKMFDIKLTDHLIITESGYFSFTDNALL